MKTNLTLNLKGISKRLLVVMSLGALPLLVGACATLDDNAAGQAVYRGPVTAGEVRDALARGVTQTELLDQIRRRGAQPPSSIEIDQLRLAGADHIVIDSLLRANHASQYIWVDPPRFSFYWGRGSWYWVNDFGWPVYPQPWGWVPDRPRFYGPHPGYPFPIKPSPRPKVAPQVGAIEDAKTGPGKDRPEAAAAQPLVPFVATPVIPNTAPGVVPSPVQNGRPTYIPKNEK